MDLTDPFRMGISSILAIACLSFLVPLTGWAESPPVEDRVLVFYPKGDCETGWIDIEVYDRDIQTWRAHAEHARVATGSCQLEDPGILLQEIRVRCADPDNRARVSTWRVGAEVFAPVGAEQCPEE